MLGRDDVVRIEVGDSVGTGFAIEAKLRPELFPDAGAGLLVVTSRHTLADDAKSVLDQKVTVVSAELHNREWRESPRQMRVVHESRADDWVILLDCPEQPPCPGLTKWRVRCRNYRDGRTWSTYGFAASAGPAGAPAGGKIRTRRGDHGGRVATVLFSHEGAAARGEKGHGYSGAPVVVDGRVECLISAMQVDDGYAERAESGRFYATGLGPLFAVDGPLQPDESSPPHKRVDSGSQVAALFSGVIDLDRDAQWQGMLSACNQNEHALITVHGGEGQSVSLFTERVKRALGRGGALWEGGPVNRFAYDLVSLRVGRADHAAPEIAGQWLDRIAQELGDGVPEEVLRNRLEEGPLLIVVEPFQVESLSAGAWSALHEFATVLLAEICPVAEEAHVLRLVVAMEFDERHSRIEEVDSWRRSFRQVSGWQGVALPTLEFPQWAAHVEPYIERHTEDMTDEDYGKLLALCKKTYDAMLKHGAMNYRELSEMLNRRIGDMLDDEAV